MRLQDRSLVIAGSVIGGLLLIYAIGVGITLVVMRPPPAVEPVVGVVVSPPELTRSAGLELVSVAAVGSPVPQLGWVLPGSGLGWGEVPVPPLPALAGLRARGEKLFGRLCVSCHGPEGRGNGWLAMSLPRRPRDLRGALRTRQGLGRASPEEVFRSLTAGAPAYGMPSFAHLPEADRWALVAHFAPTSPGVAVVLPARPGGEPDLHLGQDVYRARCASCHGRSGDGRGSLAGNLTDDRGDRCPPTDFTLGLSALRGGARAVDVARSVRLGRAGTSMVPHEDLSPAHLWAVAEYVARLVRDGEASRKLAWQRFFVAQLPPLANGSEVRPPKRGPWSRKRSARFERVPAGKPASCLGCHDGIDAIASGDMAEAIDAVAGGDEARGCAVCHAGQPHAGTKVAAHQGLIPNPGSLWVTSVGAGCAQCHSRPGALTTLQGTPLPEPVGGRLMHVTSTQTDPSGASSGNYTYRVQRSLMAQETGKVLLMTTSAGLATPDAPRFSDFPMRDPDGAVPTCGSTEYLALIQRGLKSGYLQRLERTRGVPTVSEALALSGGNKGLAGYVDYFRKQCARCHLWGEGKPANAEHRSAGCSACHVVWNNQGRSEGRDPTVPPRATGHPARHQLVLSPPNDSCYRCHTRGPLTRHSEPHERAGIGCGDCHTSIDVHGDGNLYPHMEHQVEVRCEDCHGSGARAPWELPLGHGGPLAGTRPRGTWGEKKHLLTQRGNPRSNWIREGDKAVLISLRTNQRWVTPLLKDRLGKTSKAGKTAHGALIKGHADVSCALCHNRKAPRCGECHITYYSYLKEQDWLLSAKNYDPATTRQRPVFTPGQTYRHAGGGITWGPPDTRRDRANRLVPQEPGCDVLQLRYLEKDGKAHLFKPRFNPGQPSYPPVVSNSHPHENASPPRTCNECHVEGQSEGATKATLFGHVQPDRGDWWRAAPLDDPSQAAKKRWTKD